MVQVIVKVRAELTFMAYCYRTGREYIHGLFLTYRPSVHSWLKLLSTYAPSVSSLLIVNVAAERTFMVYC